MELPSLPDPAPKEHTGREAPNTRLVYDTDATEIRRRRAERQYWYEKVLAQRTSGQPLAARHDDVRRHIFEPFGIDNTQTSAEQSSSYDRRYPNRVLVPHYSGRLSALIDGNNAELIAMTPDDVRRQERGFRLAVVNYMVGITIHRDVDGNGQTNRVLFLSYIREHCPQHMTSFLPIKYDKNFEGEDEMHYFPSLTDGIVSGEPIEYTETDRLLYELVDKIREMDDQYARKTLGVADLEAANSAYLEQLRMVVSVLRQMGIPISESTIQPDVAMTSYRIRKDICDHLKSRYPEWSFSKFYREPLVDAVSKEFALNILLNTPDGLDSLRRYVEDGFRAIDNYQPLHADTRVGQVIKSSAKALEEVESEMRRLLTVETEEAHKTKHDSHTRAPQQASST